MKRNSKYSLSQHKWHSPRLHIAYWVVDALSLMALAGGVAVYIMVRPNLALVGVVTFSVIALLLLACAYIKDTDGKRE